MYITTVIDKIVVYAYPNVNEKPSLFNFNEIDKIISNKLERYKNNQHKMKIYENYINTKLTPIRTNLGY